MSLNIEKTKSALRSFAIAHRDRLISQRLAPYITGDAGIGKTKIVKELGTELDMGVIITHVAQLEPSDLVGIPRSRQVSEDLYIQRFDLPGYLPMARKNADGSYIWVDSEDGVKRPDFMVEILGSKIKNRKELEEKHGSEWMSKIKGFILFLDEINRAVSDETKQAIFELPGDYALHEYEVPPCCMIIGAGNPPNTDYEVNSMDEDVAWMDRFIHLRATTDRESVLSHFGQNDVHPSIMSFLSNDESALIKPSVDYELNVNRSPRSYEKLSTILKEINLPEDKDILTEICIGTLGDEYGIAFAKHYLEKNDLLTSLDDIAFNYNDHRDYILELVENNSNSELNAIILNMYAQLHSEKHFFNSFIENNQMLPEVFDNLTNFLLDLDAETRSVFIKKTSPILHVNQYFYAENDKIFENYKNTILEARNMDS